MTKSAHRSHTYEYPMPAVTVDVVVFALVESKLKVLLIKRGDDPYAGYWALPGGFLEENEPISAGALRELKEETTLVPEGPLVFLNAYGNPGRDPRGWTISLAHIALVGPPLPEVVGSDDASEAEWRDIDAPSELAFDHAEILADAIVRLKSLIDLGELGLGLLPKTFGMADIERLFQTLGETPEEAETWRDYLIDIGAIEPIPRSKSKFQATSRT